LWVHFRKVLVLKKLGQITVASGPVNVWADILLTNAGNIVKGIDRVIWEISKLRTAAKSGDKGKVESLLEKARDKRGELIEYKMKRKELIP